MHAYKIVKYFFSNFDLFFRNSNACVQRLKKVQVVYIKYGWTISIIKWVESYMYRIFCFIELLFSLSVGAYIFLTGTVFIQKIYAPPLP
jgi:hypothetical protein